MAKVSLASNKTQTIIKQWSNNIPTVKMSKLLSTTIFMVILGLSSAVPQLGIKTRHPPQSGNLVNNNTAPVYSQSGDRQYDFMNKTRTDMSSGICFKEVPTVTLAGSEGHAGNGVCTIKTLFKKKTYF